MAAFSSISTLWGAIKVNRAMGAVVAAQDLGGKVAALISAMNIVNANLSTIQVVLVSAAASNVSFSAISAGTFTSSYISLTNFTTT